MEQHQWKMEQHLFPELPMGFKAIRSPGDGVSSFITLYTGFPRELFEFCHSLLYSPGTSFCNFVISVQIQECHLFIYLLANLLACLNTLLKL